MNSTFKVVFNKARGALMVVNEVTSSVQAKGTKTVVAAAVAALISGSAMAAEWQAAPEGLKAETDTVITDANWTAIKDQNAFELTANDADATKPWASVAEDQTFDKTLWVSGAGAKAHASGFGVSGENVTFTNKGTIYVTSGKDGVNYQNDAIWAGNGATAINDGKIVAKDAYGMRVGKDGNASKIVNNGSIYVESTGAGMELGGAANSEAVNNGLISVGDVNTESSRKLNFGHGVLIQDQEGAKFTNEGTITAGKGASAIEIKKHDEQKVTTAKVVLKGNSKVDGLIHVGAGVKSAVISAEEGVTDTLTLKAENEAGDQIPGTELKVLTGSTITLADKQGSKLAKVEVDETSRLNLSIFQDDNAVKEANIKGILNITHLNSKSDNATANDQILLAFGSTWNLNGGKLYVAGSEYTGTLRIGSANTKGSGTLNVSDGSDLNLTRLEVQKSGTVNVNADGSITTETLHLSKGNVNVNGGSLTVTGDKGFTVFEGTDGSNPALTLANGTFTVDAGSLFKETTAEGQKADTKTYEATDAGKAIKGNGTVNVTTSKAFEYSLYDLQKGQALLNEQNKFDIKLVLANGTLVLGENETLNANGVSGLNLAGHTGVAGAEASSVFAVTQTTTIGAINFETVTDKNAESITLGNQQALTLAGNGGDVFKNLGAKVTTVSTGDLVLGTAGNSGNVNVENLVASTLTVVGAFDAENVSFTANSSIKEGALLDVAKLTSENNTMTLGGTLVADVIAANVNVEDSGVLVLGERQLAPATAARLAEETTEPAAPEYVDQIQKVVTANTAGALVTTNMQGQALFAAAAGDLFDAEKNVGLYVDHTIGVAESGQLNVGAVTGANGSVTVGSNAVVVIDTKKFGAEDTVFDATLSVDSNAPIVLSGLTTSTSFILATAAADANSKLVDNTVFFDGKLTQAENGNLVLNTVFNDKVTDDAELNDVIKTQLDGSHNQKNADALAAIADTTKKSGLVNKEGTALTDKGVQAVEEYLVAPLTAGALNLAYDATAQVNAVVENRVLEKADGVWADVFYASNKDSERYGDFGYSADITGGTLGVDTTVSCGAKIGAAFTIGQGDADSEGTVHGYSTDADFYGISLYAGRNVADTSLRISGNLSYLMFENDIKGSVAGASADESLDGKAFTAGLRADWTAYEGAFTVAPHAGLRYTFLEMDDYRGLEIGDMNVVEMPFGVKVSGEFEPAAGWTLQPAVDFTVVPQLGDKDVDTVLGSVDVIDNLYNTELGVEAATGNFSFGLSYKYGFGKEDRKNQSLNLNARYMF